MEMIAWLFVGGGWCLIAGLSIACFRSSRDDGDRTPQGKWARGMMFICGVLFATLAFMPLAALAEHWWKSA